MTGFFSCKLEVVSGKFRGAKMRRIINVGYGLDRTVTKNEYLDLRAGQDPPLHCDCKLRKIYGKIPILCRQKQQKTSF